MSGSPPPAAPHRARWVALVGNPNTGKTTLFNALTGYRAKVGNYPGVTVDRRQGPVKALPGVEILDLPGTYSLAARAPDEILAVDVLLGRRDDTPRPDAVVLVVDASNLERNLYLASQVLETGLPVVVALNMADVARARGHEIDTAVLSRALGAAVVATSAHRGEGVPALVAALSAALEGGQAPAPLVAFPSALEEEARALDEVLAATPVGRVPAVERRRILLDVDGWAERRAGQRGGPVVAAAVAAARARLASAGAGVEGLEAALRCAAAARVAAASVRRPASPRPTASDRIDAVLAHGAFGGLVLAGVLTLVFLSIFSWAAPAMDFLEARVFGRLAQAVADWGGLGGGAVESLVVDGVIGGVGGILVFLPQILVLALLLAALEDCGYLARAAFLLDRVLRKVGLSGRAFVPLLSSFACAVPGILAARTIEHRRDRLTAVLVAPLMSCSARIPVYALIVGAFLPGLAPWAKALVFVGAYAVGIVAAVAVAWVLQRTVLRGEARPFVIELPPYRVPSPSAVAHRAWEQGREFVVRAGTLILATSIVVWALGWFPRDPAIGAARDGEVAAARAAAERVRASGAPPEAVAAAEDAAQERAAAAEAHASGRWLRESWLGRAGRAVEPAFAPIGWDWKVAVAVLASFPAREVVVSTMGVIYDLEGADEGSGVLRERLREARWESGPRAGQPVFDLGSALALLVFFALCCQCVSTLAVLRKETGSWRWPALAFGYMTALAWLGALGTAWAVRGLGG